MVLVDEYDKPVLDVLDMEAYFYDDYGEKVLLENHNREIMKSFYSTFKGADEYLRFVSFVWSRYDSIFLTINREYLSDRYTSSRTDGL